MRRARAGTGDEGVQTLDPMREAVGDKEFKRPVGDRRLRAEPLFPQPVEHIIGSKRPVFSQEDFEHPFAHRGQPQATVRASRAGGRDRSGHAGVVVVTGKAEGGHDEISDIWALDTL